ncbi:MAG: hypothetical protein FWD85_07535 [Microbacteriaceae bacterium]|nr:hypothetical protein [Microbacteriaceae bacterium]
MRLRYEDVDEAVLNPDSATLSGRRLSVDGFVTGSNLLVKPALRSRRKQQIPVVLCIEPVDDWTFEGIALGSGELITGEFEASEHGGRIRGVIPGDLVVTSTTQPTAWYETEAPVPGDDHN